MTDLPAALRERLAQVSTVGRADLVTSQTSLDGTTKLLQELGVPRARIRVEEW